MVFIFAYPILMLAIFATVFGQDGATVGPVPRDPVRAVLPAGHGRHGHPAVELPEPGDAIAVERDEGGLKRLRGTPMPASAYFLGKVGSVLVTASCRWRCCSLAASPCSASSCRPTSQRWVTFAWVFALGTAAGTVCGVAFSSVPRTGGARPRW